MEWKDFGAIFVGVVFLYIVIRSITQHYRSSEATPLRGKHRAAQEWLEENGYKVIRVRERGSWEGYYDRRAFEKQLIADFVVRQGGKYYAVKVMNSRDKQVSGQKLRDQWFPLFVAFGVDGVLHIDVDSEQVHTVDFSLRTPSYARWRRLTNRGLWLLSGIFIALAFFRGH